jgi:NADH-quinone oxidoreductase subunit N
MTLSMLALAGIPATAGFTGKFYLIDAAVSGGYAWLGVVIVVGSMISLGYYLPVVAQLWMRGAGAPQPTPPTAIPGAEPLPHLAGGSQELDARTPVEVVLVALVAGAGTLFFGIVPQPLFELVHSAGASFLGLF